MRDLHPGAAFSAAESRPRGPGLGDRYLHYFLPNGKMLNSGGIANAVTFAF